MKIPLIYFRIHIPIINSNKALWVSEAIISMLYHVIFILNPTLSAIPKKQLEQPKKWKKKMMKINKWFVTNSLWICFEKWKEGEKEIIVFVENTIGEEIDSS
jgi:hypothetical protein